MSSRKVWDSSYVWRVTSVIAELLGRYRQEVEFDTRMGYMVRPYLKTSKHHLPKNIVDFQRIHHFLRYFHYIKCGTVFSTAL
jgi:hypothetical protein